MKNLLSHTLCCLFLLVGLAACIEDDLGQKGGSSSSDGEVTLKFSTAIPGLETVNTRSIDPDGEPIQMMWLFLFDENGYYLGHVKADALTYTAGSATTTAHGTFTATVTSSTRRIHFVANYQAADINDNDHLGQLETEMMPQFTSTSGRLVYWGRETFASQEELEAFAEGTSGETVTLYRNQAAVTWNAQSTAVAGSDISIEGFAILNKYARGTVAPYHHDESTEGHDPFDFSLDGTHDFVTLCSGDERVKATNPTETVQMNEWGMRYIFEHDNPVDDQVYVIFRINTLTGTQTGTRYYKLFIQDKDSEPYLIIRNHRYVFNFQGTPPASLGYASFEEAVNGVAANNVWVSIDDELPTIGDGTTELSIEGETTRIYTSQQDEVIRFTYDGTDAVTAEWISNPGLAAEDLDLQFSNGQGSVTVKLNQIGDEPQYGTLQIKAGKYTRRIHIIYLKNFEFTPVWTSSSVPRRAGEPVSIMFHIPDTYPEELFPIECKISCNRFDANASTTNHGALDVIQEETRFTVGDQTYDRDWDYKYVFRVDKSGPHRVDFETAVSDFTTDGNVEWFLEANYFNTVRREIPLVDADRADQKILFQNGTGTDNIAVPPVKGTQFDVLFRLEGGTPNGTVVRVYVNTEAVQPAEGTNLGNLHTDDGSGMGPYYLYTISNASPTETIGSQTYYKLTFETIVAESTGYIRLAAAEVDQTGDNEQAHCYKSAIITRTCTDPYNLNFRFDNGQKESTVSYGEGVPVNLHLTFPDLTGVASGTSCTFFIQTEELEPAAGQAGLAVAEGGYVYTLADVSAQQGDITLQMQAKDIVSADDISISETSGNIAFVPETISLKNAALTGQITYQETGGFPTDEPFIALETRDGTRIGYFTITNAQGQSSATYSLTLYGEYEFTSQEPLTVLYSPLNDNRTFICSTTVRDLLQSSPTLALQLQQ